MPVTTWGRSGSVIAGAGSPAGRVRSAATPLSVAVSRCRISTIDDLHAPHPGQRSTMPGQRR